MLPASNLDLAVHIAFRDGKLRIEEQRPLDPGIAEVDRATAFRCYRRIRGFRPLQSRTFKCPDRTIDLKARQSSAGRAGLWKSSCWIAPWVIAINPHLACASNIGA